MTHVNERRLAEFRIARSENYASKVPIVTDDTPLFPRLGSSLLLTDLYELNMIQAYLEAGLTEQAEFEFFVRKLPRGRGFLMTAGLEQAVAFLEAARFQPDELTWLKDSGRFSNAFIDYLEAFRFTGDLHALTEGTIFFPDEPILRLTASLPEAQLFETRLINLVHFQSLVASKAARMVLAAGGRPLIDFGLRRAHGAEAGLLAARACYIAGFAGTATVPAARYFGIPIFGTMAHSYVQAHASEEEAFASFARARPDQTVFLIDTYDTEQGAEKVAALAPKLGAQGIAIKGVRLDSGDLGAHARRVRKTLDDAGLSGVKIMASGGVDERLLQRLSQDGVPIDSFGVGTSVTTSQDAPALDCAYKLKSYAGIPRRKRSEGKRYWPGPTQVLRRLDADGVMSGDTVTRDREAVGQSGLLRHIIRSGRRVTAVTLDEARLHAAAELGRLPAKARRLGARFHYPVEVSPGLQDLARDVDRRIEKRSIEHTVGG